MGDTVNVASRLEGVATRWSDFGYTEHLSVNPWHFRVSPIGAGPRAGEKGVLFAVFELLEPKIQRDTKRGLEGLVSPLVGREWEKQSNEKSYRCDQARSQRTYSRLRRCRGGKKPAAGGNADLANPKALPGFEGRCFASTQTLSYASDPRPSPKTYRHHG